MSNTKRGRSPAPSPALPALSDGGKEDPEDISKMSTVYRPSDAILSDDVERRDIPPGLIIGMECYYGRTMKEALEAADSDSEWFRGIIQAAAGTGFIVKNRKHGTAVTGCVVPTRDKNEEPIRIQLLHITRSDVRPIELCG